MSFYTRAFEAEDLGRLGHGRVHRVTSQTSNPQIQFVAAGLVTGNELQGVFIGDYTAVALGSDGVLHPCWTDFRGKPGVTDPMSGLLIRARCRACRDSKPASRWPIKW